MKKELFREDTIYYQNNRPLLVPGVFFMNNSNHEQINEAVKRGRMNIYPGPFLSTAGASIISYALVYKGFVNLFDGEDTNITMPLISGTALISVSMPLIFAYYRHIERGVKIFNNEVRCTNSSASVSVDYMITAHGIVFTINF